MTTELLCVLALLANAAAVAFALHCIQLNRETTRKIREIVERDAQQWHAEFVARGDEPDGD
jgi:hypothetical protein